MFHLCNIALNTALGTLFGISSVYDAGSYVDGEETVNGKQVLVYSPLKNRQGFPCHADNFARGLYKVQQESGRIFGVALATSLVAQAVLQESLPRV